MAQISTWDARATQRKQAILSFDPSEDRFDVDSAREIGWLGRFVHYWRLLLNAEGVEREATAQGRDRAEVGPLATAVVIDFLELLEVVELQGAGMRLQTKLHERILEWLERITAAGKELLDDSGDDPAGEAILLAASIVIEEQQERLSGFRFEHPEHVIPQELLLGSANVVRRILFPYGWGAPSSNGPVQIPFEFVVQVCRRSGVAGSVAFVNAPKEKDLIVLIDEADAPRAEEGQLAEALSALLRVPTRVVTDASAWGGDVLSLTPGETQPDS